MPIDIFLKFDPEIKSGAGQGDHKDWIEVLSFSWGEQGGTSSGHSAGRVSLTDFNFNKKTSKASVELFHSCATAKHFKGVQIDRLQGGGLGTIETIIKLEDVLVSGYTITGSEGSDLLDSVQLNFSKLSFKYQPHDARTKKVSGGPVETQYDFRTQK